MKVSMLRNGKLPGFFDLYFNMLYLYTTEFHHKFLPGYFLSLISLLPPELQNKVYGYRRWEDAYSSLLGKHLLRIGLKAMQLSCDLSRLHYSINHKPLLKNGPYFNISHSGNRVVCLVCGDTRVGVDIEKINGIAIEDFQTQFSSYEWFAIQSSSTPLKTFYQYWTAKESIIKGEGRGLQIPLLQLDVSQGGAVMLDGKYWQLLNYSNFEGYACHLAFELRSSGKSNSGVPPDSFLDIPEIKFHEIEPGDILQASR